MFAEPLDNKGECVGFYYQNQIIQNPPDYVKSWSYHPSFKGGDYAYLYCQDEINKLCPDNAKDDWKLVNDKMKAYFKSFKRAK